ncbi:MAG: O-antigen/teichoic acid export membrane protein [Psychroserpens sp.]|jgi:O-antigen/teichoic acid export membrane protein
MLGERSFASRTGVNRLQPPSISSSSALKNTIWLFSEKVIAMAILLLVNIVMARQLGPEYFGSLSILLSFIAIFTPIIALGLNAIVTRELCIDKSNEGKIVGTVLVLRCVGVVIGTTCILILANSVVEVLKPHFVLILILVVGNSFSLFSLIEHWFQSRMESKYVSVIKTIILMVFSAIRLVVAYAEPNILNFVIVQAAEWTVVGVILAAAYFKKRKKTFSLEVDLVYGIKLLKESVWLIFSGVAAVIYLKIDQLMLGAMVGETEVGIYSVAVKFSEIWYFFPAALAASFFPKLLNDKHLSPEKYNNALQMLLDFMFLLALVVAVFTVLFSSFFIPFLYGAEYLDSVKLLNIQIWACCFVFMRAISSKWLIAESLVKFSLLSQGSGAIINIVMNYYLIPIWKAEGAAWATLVSYFFASYVCFWLFSDTRQMARKMSLALFFPMRARSHYQIIQNFIGKDKKNS